MKNILTKEQAAHVYSAMCALGDTINQRAYIDFGTVDVTRFGDGTMVAVSEHSPRVEYANISDFASAYGL